MDNTFKIIELFKFDGNYSELQKRVEIFIKLNSIKCAQTQYGMKLIAKLNIIDEAIFYTLETKLTEKFEIIYKLCRNATSCKALYPRSFKFLSSLAN